MNNNQKHYFWLDLLRCLSALFVVIAHVRANFFDIYCYLEPSSQNVLTKIFYVCCSFSDDGVLIFFILSGFLVGGKTIKSLILRAPISASKFAIDKSIRIGLPLVASLVAIIFINLLIGESTDYIRLIGNMFSVQGIWVAPEGGILWTMPYIVWYYVFIFSLILLFNKATTKRNWGIITMAISLIMFTLSGDSLSTYFFFIVSFGIIAYYFSEIKIPKRFIYTCIVVAIFCAIASKFARPSISREQTFFSLFNVSVLNIVETLTLAIITSQLVRIIPKTKFAIKLNQISSKLAIFSYSLYLIHYQIIRIMIWLGFPKSNTINLTSLSLFIVEIIICIIGGYLFYLCAEKHTNNIKKFIHKKIGI